MSNIIGNTSVKEFDFNSGIALDSVEGFTFKIGEVGLLDTKFGVMAVITDKDSGVMYYTGAEVIVNAIRSSINKGIKLVNRIVTLKRNDSTSFDEETGEFYQYLTLEHATPEEMQDYRENRLAENKAKREAFELNQNQDRSKKTQKEEKE